MRNVLKQCLPDSFPNPTSPMLVLSYQTRRSKNGSVVRGRRIDGGESRWGRFSLGIGFTSWSGRRTASGSRWIGRSIRPGWGAFRRPRTSIRPARSRIVNESGSVSASADTKPRSMRSMTTGPRPVLMTCAPRPHTMPRSPARASRTAATTALKSARIRGSASIQPATPVAGSHGFAKS